MCFSSRDTLIQTATITLAACHSYTAALHVSGLLPNSTHAPEDVRPNGKPGRRECLCACVRFSVMRYDDLLLD